MAARVKGGPGVRRITKFLAGIFARIFAKNAAIKIGVLAIKIGVLADAERGLRVLQLTLNPHCGRMHATEDAPRGLFRVLQCRHGLAEIVERGAVVSV